MGKPNYTKQVLNELAKLCNFFYDPKNHVKSP